jgi:hypothetical protein
VDDDSVVKLDFSFPVGTGEQHTVHFSFDQVWGFLTIRVDGKPVVRAWPFISFSLSQQYRLTVGEQERHDVLIIKERQLVFAGFRAQVCRVFVDGVPAGEYSSATGLSGER